MSRAHSFVVATFIAVAAPILLTFTSSEAAVMEVGKVKCILIVNFTESYRKAHHTCWEKQEKEHKDKKDKEHKPYPFNATIEEFEFDDNCEEHCIYKTVGILSDDETLPEKKYTSTIFGKGKTTDDHYKVITTSWDECLNMSTEIGKKKNWDKCKVVTHHKHCFDIKMYHSITKLQIDC